MNLRGHDLKLLNKSKKIVQSMSIDAKDELCLYILDNLSADIKAICALKHIKCRSVKEYDHIIDMVNEL